MLSLLAPSLVDCRFMLGSQQHGHAGVARRLDAAAEACKLCHAHSANAHAAGRAAAAGHPLDRACLAPLLPRGRAKGWRQRRYLIAWIHTAKVAMAP